MIYAGPAHSASDMMMMVEPDGVLFAGDIVQNSRIPFMNSDDVNTKQWLEALGVVEKLDPKFIIPGHGRPSWSKRLSPSPAITSITCALQSARRSKTGPILTSPIGRPTGRNTPAFETNNRGNAYRIFLELEQSQFGGAKP